MGISDWAPCAEQELSRFQCATAVVPLDYAHPEGPTLSLAVLRQPASDPELRIGTLFAGVGGPGGAGFRWAAGGELLGGEIARRFDVVTFDQRGVGRSAQVRCFANAEEQQRFWSRVSIPPANPEQERDAARASRELAVGCAAHSGALLGHLTTVDVARDLDLLRRAVGDPKLSYEGGSYASYLGEVYGALFGDRVRAAPRLDDGSRRVHQRHPRRDREHGGGHRGGPRRIPAVVCRCGPTALRLRRRWETECHRGAGGYRRTGLAHPQ
ncbi:alpha/beta fold hydrolase [Nocardia sp. NBC_00881]|uniref:alpha/beta fold hydrolase n=1 Tax=Nocardia sp. NBC_00881 TaxID=2975995 RepID=UPI00386908F9|nr:alpha/beta fold hydrolase [Nocardia sp. NBC_00881]